MKRSRLHRIGRKGESEKQALIELRVNVLARANGRCERCGKWVGYFYLHVHHRKPRSRGGEHTLKNAVAMCGLCHMGVHEHRDSDWQDWID